MYFRVQRYILLAVIATGLLLAGCSINVSTPASSPASVQKIPIRLAYPTAAAQLSLDSNLPGMLRLAGYSGGDFVSGSIEVSDQEWAPRIEKGDHGVTLIQNAGDRMKVNGGFQNLWKIMVSDSQPFQLEIINKLAEGHWNLSGLPITSLEVEAGAAKNAFTFDEANPGLMQNFQINCGSGEVIVERILNAGCKEMLIEGGTGPLTLRLNGKEVMQNLQIRIEGGNGLINIEIRPETAVRISIDNSIDVILGDSFVKIDNEGDLKIYETAAYSQSDARKIEISIFGVSSKVTINPVSG